MQSGRNDLLALLSDKSNVNLGFNTDQFSDKLSRFNTCTQSIKIIENSLRHSEYQSTVCLV